MNVFFVIDLFLATCFPFHAVNKNHTNQRHTVFHLDVDSLKYPKPFALFSRFNIQFLLCYRFEMRGKYSGGAIKHFTKLKPHGWYEARQNTLELEMGGVCKPTGHF